MLRQDDGSAYPWWHYALLPFVLLLQIGFTLLIVAINILIAVGLVYLGWRVLFG